MNLLGKCLRAAKLSIHPLATPVGLSACQDRILSSYQACSYHTEQSKLRNVAIIAHIDHGKTTLMDRLLAFCGKTVKEDRVMDSNVLEKERGITILSKITSFGYKDYLINAVDTPGHADFGGEVERVLGLVEGVLLLVDATEGPLAQTKFVVAKALAAGLRPIVVLNKVDRESATRERCGATESAVFDLLASMGATDEQLDFPVLYASAKQGWACRELPEGGQAPPGADMTPLLETVVRHVPPPGMPLDAPFAMCVAMIERDPYVGRIATGRIASGQVKVGDRIRVLQRPPQQVAARDDDQPDPASQPAVVLEEARVVRIMKRAGVETHELPVAIAGDIVSLAGVGSAAITDTVAAAEVGVALDPGHVDPPTLSMVFGANDSPLAGKGGRAVTSRAIGERLMAEAETSVSLKVLPVTDGGEKYEVHARGELQLGVLVENLRREGMELSVSPPTVLLREEAGRKLEPMEEVTCELSEDQAGAVIEALTQRRGELQEMGPIPGGRQRLVFSCPSRGMLGFKTQFASLTRGEGLLQRAFLRYDKYRGPLDSVRKGVIVSSNAGKATTYALWSLQDRGVFFVPPGAEIYSGMVVGEHSRDTDLEVNPCKEKKLTNVRSVEADDKMFMPPPRVLSLEEAIGYVASDELIEVTPTAVRLRKRVLDASRRRSLGRASAKAA